MFSSLLSASTVCKSCSDASINKSSDSTREQYPNETALWNALSNLTVDLTVDALWHLNARVDFTPPHVSPIATLAGSLAEDTKDEKVAAADNSGSSSTGGTERGQTVGGTDGLFISSCPAAIDRTPTPATHAILTVLKAGETVCQTL